MAQTVALDHYSGMVDESAFILSLPVLLKAYLSI